MSCWLHRFATRHPHEVSFGDYSYIASDCLKEAKRLNGYGLDCLFVFDGAYMPGKGGTTKARANLRLKHRQEAADAQADGRGEDYLNFLK